MSSLPTIVVAGDQSCGKSSLIEAISGVSDAESSPLSCGIDQQINLPRSVGTCTRVPIEVRLRYEPNEAWRSAVKTRQEVKSEGGDKVSKSMVSVGSAAAVSVISALISG